MKKNIAGTSARRNGLLALCLCGSLISSCALFTSHFDAIRQQNFTQLKAFHIKFLEDWSEGSAKEWSRAMVLETCDTGDLKFREASEYAAAKDASDETAIRAVSILWAEFKENCALAANKQIPQVAAKELIEEVSNNYRLAIEGEMARVGSPN